MSVRLVGMGNLLVGLMRLEDRTHSRLRRAAVRGAKKIGDTAREYAPVDRGDLEGAIRSDQRERDQRNRLIMLVGVDHSRLGPGWQRDGFDYPYEMHENYPYPVGGIPDKPAVRGSYLKQAAGNEVGGQFLLRALQKHEDEIRAEMARILGEVTSGA